MEEEEVRKSCFVLKTCERADLDLVPFPELDPEPVLELDVDLEPELDLPVAEAVHEPHDAHYGVQQTQTAIEGKVAE